MPSDPVQGLTFLIRLVNQGCAQIQATTFSDKRRDHKVCDHISYVMLVNREMWIIRGLRYQSAVVNLWHCHNSFAIFMSRREALHKRLKSIEVIRSWGMMMHMWLQRELWKIQDAAFGDVTWVSVSRDFTPEENKQTNKIWRYGIENDWWVYFLGQCWPAADVTIGVYTPTKKYITGNDAWGCLGGVHT